jgi:hypothetical protein
MTSTVERNHSVAVGDRRFEGVQHQLAVAQSSVEQENRLARATGVGKPRPMSADLEVSARALGHVEKIPA